MTLALAMAVPPSDLTRRPDQEPATDPEEPQPVPKCQLTLVQFSHVV